MSYVINFEKPKLDFMGTLIALCFILFFFLNLVGIVFNDDGEKRNYWFLLIIDALYILLVIVLLKLLLPIVE